MTYTDIQTEQPLTIEGIAESAIINYFATINQEEFSQTAALFAEDGELLAPFEKPIVGRKAIASYLTKEAKGMKLLPKQGISEPAEADLEKIQVTGKVQTSLFSVNVAWHFSLNQNQQITTAKIKLLASPQELLGMNYPNLLRSRWGFPISAQFRDGFIRPRSFPFHRSMPFTSKLIIGLTHPQQAATAVPSVDNLFSFIWLTYIWTVYGLVLLALHPHVTPVI